MSAGYFDVVATALNKVAVSSATRAPSPTRSEAVRVHSMLCSSACLLLLGLPGCGPVYLHDPAGERAATAAIEDFQATVQNGSVAGLVATYRVQQAAVAETIRTLQKDDTRTQMVALPSESWQDIIEATRSELDETAAALQSIEVQRAELEAAFQVAPAADAAPDAQSLLAAMNAAANDEARYVATQRLLSTGLAVLVGGETGQQGASTERLKSLLDETVPVRSFKDENGRLQEVQGQKTVGQLLGLDPALVDAFDAKPASPNDLLELANVGKQALDFAGLQLNNPGIAVTIIGLSYDVARTQELRSAAAIRTTRQKLALYDDFTDFLQAHENNLAGNLGRIESLQRQQGLGGETSVRSAIESLATRESPSRSSLLAIYSEIGNNFQYRVVDAGVRDDFTAALDNLEVEEALASAALNLREREAVIFRGLEGLVAFHKGGIDAEDVNNLIGVAQAIGIFAIASK